MKPRSLLARLTGRAGPTGTPSVSYFAKLVMLLEAVVILFFTFWFAQQYNNDQYFQGYVNSTVQANLIAIELGTTAATFLAAIFFAKIRQAQHGHGPIHLEVTGTLHRNQSETEPDSLNQAQEETRRKEPDAPPALASAAHRVLKRMGPGQGALGGPLFQKNTIVLKQPDPKPTPPAAREVPADEKRSRILMGAGPGEGPAPPVRRAAPTPAPTPPIFGNKQPAEIRGPVREFQAPPRNTGPLPPPAIRPHAPKPPTLVTGIPPTPITRDTKPTVPPPTSLSPPITRETKPTAPPPISPSPPPPVATASPQFATTQNSAPARPVRLTPGPLENPLPGDALLPTAKRTYLGDEAQESSPRPLTSMNTSPEQPATLGQATNRAGLSPRLAERAQTIANKLPAQKIPMIVVPAPQLNPPPRQPPPTIQPMPQESPEKTRPANPKPITSDPLPRNVAGPSPQGLQANLGRVEPVRGVMGKPSGLKPPQVARREGPAQAQAELAKPVQISTAADQEKFDERKPAQKRPPEKRVDDYGSNEDGNPII